MGRDLDEELREAGAADEMVSELIQLAEEIEELPPIEPRRSWLVESKWRLLRRFDEQQSTGPVDPEPADA